MKKIALSLLLFFPFAGCLPNCGQGDVLPYYDVQGINAFADRVVRVEGAYGSTKFIVNSLPEGRPVIPDSLVLEVAASVTYHAGLPRNPWAGAGAAYACSPKPNGEEGSKESVKELVVRCEQDFDATHPAGSSLNEYFEYVSVSEYRSQFVPVGNLADYVQQFPAMPPRNFALRLLKAPAQKAGPYTFTIYYELTNGEAYTVRTGGIAFR